MLKLYLYGKEMCCGIKCMYSKRTRYAQWDGMEKKN